LLHGGEELEEARCLKRNGLVLNNYEEGPVQRGKGGYEEGGSSKRKEG